jgi:heterodisulfide reductase subunit B
MTTKPEVARVLVAGILKQARGADMILTVCPMCQMNLEGFQKKISGISKESLDISVLYLPQFLGMAMGLPGDETRMDLNLCITSRFKEKYQSLISGTPALVAASA